jgi:hypothetical protein
MKKAKDRSRSRAETRQPSIVPKSPGFIWLKFKRFSTQLSSCGEKVSEEVNKYFASERTKAFESSSRREFEGLTSPTLKSPIPWK